MPPATCWNLPGNEVVRANYIGDIGLHVIKWLWNYMKFHAGEQPPVENRTRWMGDLYAEAEKRFEASEENEAEVRALFGRWEQRDPEVVELWQEIPPVVAGRLCPGVRPAGQSVLTSSISKAKKKSRARPWSRS